MSEQPLTKQSAQRIADNHLAGKREAAAIEAAAPKPAADIAERRTLFGKRPAVVAAPAPDTGCMICDRPIDNTVDNTPLALHVELCDRHRSDVCQYHAGIALRAIVPALHHTARPTMLLPELATWTPAHGGVFLYGLPGRGKSFQAACLVRKAWESWTLEHGRPPYIVWRNLSTMLEDIQATMGRKGEKYDPGPARTCELLVLDELGFAKVTEWSRDVVYNLINERYERGLPMIVTSNLDLNEVMKRIAPQIASRLAHATRQVKVVGADRRKSLDPFITLPGGAA